MTVRGKILNWHYYYVEFRMMVMTLIYNKKNYAKKLKPHFIKQFYRKTLLLYWVLNNILLSYPIHWLNIILLHRITYDVICMI